jgi:regulator of RNase E activity RraA
MEASVSTIVSQIGGRAPGRPATDQEIAYFRQIENELYTAVISDALDEVGYCDRAMREYLRPLALDMVVAGWARTVACTDVYHVPAEPYAMELEALDSTLPGEVLVVSTNNSTRNAPWGELLSTATVARGGRGAIVDGLVRDTKRIREMGFPVFAAGIKPVDSKGRGVVFDYNIPVNCAGVLVTPGDLVVADCDGVVVVPSEAAEETIRLAKDKATRENYSREELRRGAYLRDVYNRYGVL